MLRIATLAATAAILALAPGLASAGDKTVDVGSFHAVDVQSGITANVTAGASQSVVAHSPNADALKMLRTDVRSGTLVVWLDKGVLGFLMPDPAVTLDISAPVLDGVESSSGASVTVTSLKGDALRLEASSGASLVSEGMTGKQYDLESSSGARLAASGSCDTANIDASSGASVGAKGLDCSHVSLDVSSGAHIEITARETIKADASSGGSATVHGKPRVDSIDADSGGSVDFPN